MPVEKDKSSDDLLIAHVKNSAKNNKNMLHGHQIHPFQDRRSLRTRRMTFRSAVQLHVAGVCLTCLVFLYIFLRMARSPQQEAPTTTIKDTPEDIALMKKILNADGELSHQWAPGEVLGDVTKLNVPEAGLSRLPKMFCEVLPNLSILFLPKNNFEEMPGVIGECAHLQMVSFKSNGMKRINPNSLQPQLRWLILTDNKIQYIPPTIGRCTSLRKCMLSGNKLQSLPSEMSKCKSLELIRLASNQLQEAPMHVLELPNLAWVAMSGNPFSQADQDKVLSKAFDELDQPSQAPPLPVLSDPELEDTSMGKILGQGASGITRKVFWKSRGEDVAVKTYVSGTITSDGSPLQERTINRLLAMHPVTQDSPYLIHVLGQTPINESLVMELMSDVQAFGEPPSMESCSRDVYPETKHVSENQVRRMVVGLWTILRDLHGLHVCHGDFYGHNILVSSDEAMERSDEFVVKLSDFGAAFFCSHEKPYGRQMERIEMRAFGHFIEELHMLHLRGKARASPLGRPLHDLAEACTQKSTFAELRLFVQKFQ